MRDQLHAFASGQRRNGISQQMRNIARAMSGSQRDVDDARHRGLPFPSGVVIRVGDDAAETDAFHRARNFAKSDGNGWNHGLLMREIARQLSDAAGGVCPWCSGESPI
jgi:hypothetical protein